MTEKFNQTDLVRPTKPTAALSYAEAIPSIALLSNSQYSVMVTAAGAGYSTWRGLDVTRWREDATRDCWGQFCYVRDLTDDKSWSIGLQPLCTAADEYEYDLRPIEPSFGAGTATSKHAGPFVSRPMPIAKCAR